MKLPFVRRGRYAHLRRVAVAWKRRLLRLEAVTAGLRERVSGLETLLSRTDAELGVARAEAVRLREANERLVDNELFFGAGRAPVYDPQAPRFQPRPLPAEEPPPRLSIAAWRRRQEEREGRASGKWRVESDEGKKVMSDE